ncbi:MAG: hypothetical protein CM15mP49_14630 [Actinomycetota bacterium]|nr:MAG: hypothetical protein CM15mP49_14630 [Actinomycetota bacterium]
MSQDTVAKLNEGEVPKGDVFAAADSRYSSIKRTSELIPLCHPLAINAVSVDLTVHDDHVAIEARVSIEGKTGVEMEALTACSVAALTIYDMCKALIRRWLSPKYPFRRKLGNQVPTNERLDLAQLKDYRITKFPAYPPFSKELVQNFNSTAKRVWWRNAVNCISYFMGRCRCLLATKPYNRTFTRS